MYSLSLPVMVGLVEKKGRKVTGIISYHSKDAYNMHPFVNGEFMSLEYCTYVSSNRFSITKADTLKKE